METRKFPMGFWNYTQTGQLGPKDVTDWSDCGMTLTMSPAYDPDRHNKAELLALLDACAEQGIQLIVCDARTHWHGAARDEAGYRARFQAAYDDFGRHPAVFGFHVGDEPRASDRADCIAACRMQRELAPELTPFLNHFPWHSEINLLLETTDYAGWLTEFVRESGSPVLCYDCYSQMNPEDEGIEMYYKNLQVFSSAAKAADVPLWTTLLSVGHFRYRCPSEDELRWQLSTAAASGCQGILWFFFYERIPFINYRLPPIDEFWEKTPTYWALRRCVRRFMEQHAEVLQKLKLQRVYHVGKAYGGYPLFEKNVDPLLKNVQATERVPLVVSFFADDAGREYCCVVNNSQKENTLATLTFAGADTKLYIQNFGRTEALVGVQQDAFYARRDTEIVSGTWLAPGQMELYRIER